MNGIELLKRIKEFDPAIPVVITTAFGLDRGAVAAVKLGAFDYVKKPLDLEELKLLADRARETSLMKRELSYLRQRVARDVPFDNVLGESPVMRGILEQVRQIAALDETPPVLITGETGTGKGSWPGRFMLRAAVRHRPFIDVNCTALPRHSWKPSSSATSAALSPMPKSRRSACSEAAEGGFLFLDEIGDVELALQGKLLARHRRTRWCARSAGSGTGRSTCGFSRRRTGTWNGMPAGSGSGRDLYFRLAVILIRLPPLRDRGNDILLLAEHYAAGVLGQVRAREVRGI